MSKRLFRFPMELFWKVRCELQLRLVEAWIEIHREEIDGKLEVGDDGPASIQDRSAEISEHEQSS